MNQTNDLSYWPVLRLIPNEFLQDRVEKVFIFHYGKSCLLITKDDHVFACGNNHYGRLGIGCNTDSVQHPEEIEQLSGKKIIHLNEGCNVIMCLTDNGTLYSWGYNHNGRLGLGDEIPENLYHPMKIKIPNCKKVVMGKDHSLAIDQQGILWSWGGNSSGQLGIGGFYNSSIPCRVIDDQLRDNVKDVAATMTNSMALVGTEQLFVWGRFPQKKYDKPEKVALDNFPDIKLNSIVAAGGDHFIVLDEKGRIYLFNCLIMKFKISEIEMDYNQVTIRSIFSDCKNVCAFLLDKDGYFHVWDNRTCLQSSSPKEKIVKTSLTSLPDVHYLYGRPITPILTRLNFSTIKPFCRLNDQTTSDIEFTFDLKKKSNKILYAHKDVLEKKMKYINSMINATGECATKRYAIFFTYIRFLYTNEFQLEKELINDILEFSKKYKENSLRKKCQKLILNNFEDFSLDSGLVVENGFDEQIERTHYSQTEFLKESIPKIEINENCKDENNNEIVIEDMESSKLSINLGNFLELYEKACKSKNPSLGKLIIEFVKKHRSQVFTSSTFTDHPNNALKCELIWDLLFEIKNLDQKISRHKKSCLLKIIYKK